MEDQSHEQTHSGRADPAQPQLKEGQVAVSEADDSGDSRGLRDGLGQRLHEIEEGGHQREARDPPIHHGIVAVQISQQRQQDQGDGQWEQEHQHRQRDGDDGVKADVGDQQVKNTEADGPETVFRPIGEHGGEGFGTAGDQTDGGLETRQNHRQCQHHDDGHDHAGLDLEARSGCHAGRRAALFARIAKGELVSREASAEMLAILRQQHYNTMLTHDFPQYYLDCEETGAPELIWVASKSGSMNACRNDGGIVHTPYGEYVIVLMNKDFHDIIEYNEHPAMVYGARVSRMILDQVLACEGRLSLP